ncbi:MAG: glycoside hydrolase family 3 C-terminal domain-containing protein [Microthrixaceae bacterium]|nr:glycoside hydrolase family 3 C-terminal domain-containing protein [Microthrixaceae bacterium]
MKLLSGRGFWILESVPEHGIQGIMVTDGPHGLRCQITSADHLGLAAALPSTCFPPAVTLGSSWDAAMLTEVGTAIAEEAVSLGVSVVLGPGINLKRHPAGGRCFEYLSEDPLLSGTLATAMVRGIQSRGVGTSLKHFAVNNQESHRLIVDAVVDERTLRELYLRAFEMVVTEAQPWTVMCSYNLLNGTYTSEHPELLTTILRDEWGFEGLVMSDWGAVNDRAKGIAAGLDLEMPGSRGANDDAVVDAVGAGKLTEEAVDRCAHRVVELLQRGQDVRRADCSGVPEIGSADRDAHHDVARRAAAAGTVLLSNNGALPLSADRHIAVVGAFASDPRYQGAGSSQVNPTRLDRALEELRDRVAPAGAPGEVGRVTYAQGYEARDGSCPSGLLEEAVSAAHAADVVVLFAGLPAAAESEGFDRTTLDLPDGQVELIEALAATPTPVVVVLNNGGAVHMEWAQRVDAVLECWLGGQAGGSAVVDVLLGDAEPGGRLAESIPVHVAQLPAHRNFPGHPRQVEYRESLYVGYRFHDTAGVPARFAFGHGLSYTTFEWSEASVEKAGADGEVDFEVRVTVTNTGERSGSDVVQVYVRDVESSVHRPDKELAGFAKVHLEPGGSEVVVIRLDRRSFAVWDVAAHDWLVEEGTFEVIVARSSVDPVEVTEVTVGSTDVLGPTVRPAAFVATDDEFAAMLGRPIPTPAPTRPFDRNSTLEEMQDTRLGRMLASAVTREAVKRTAEEFPDPDDATIEMIRSSIREAPARSMVLMSGGMVDFAQLDVLIDALNANWSAAGAGLVEQIRRALGTATRSGSAE